MAYTLWRRDVQLGFTVGEVTCNPAGTLSADMQMLSTYTLPAGFAQWSAFGTIDLIIKSPERNSKREPPEPCPVHAGSGRGCFRAREYTGPVEHPTPATAFVLRDAEDQPLELAMLSVHDRRFLFSLLGPGFELPAPHFRLMAILAEVLKIQRDAECVARAT